MTIKHTKQSPRRLILAAGIYTAAASVHVLIKKKWKKIINKLLTFFKKNKSVAQKYAATVSINLSLAKYGQHEIFLVSGD